MDFSVSVIFTDFYSRYIVLSVLTSIQGFYYFIKDKFYHAFNLTVILEYFKSGNPRIPPKEARVFFAVFGLPKVSNSLMIVKEEGASFT